MVVALEMAWAAIQARHPELPAVVMVLGAGFGNGPGLTLGHFAAMRWRAPASATVDDDPDNQGQDNEEEDQHNEEGGAHESAEPQRWAEVFVGGEGLARGPADVLATLLHEAAHALAHARGIKTPVGRAAGTTRGSRRWPRKSGSAWRKTPGPAGPRPPSRAAPGRGTRR